MADEQTQTQTQSTEGTQTTTETTTALGTGLAKATTQETTPKDGGTQTETQEKPAGAPETYSAWTLPQGYELDSGVSDAAGKIFKELNLPQEAAQKLVDFYSEHAIKTFKDANDAWHAERQGWRDQLKADEKLGKLLGPDGNFGPDSPLIVTVNRALDGLQDPKLVSSFKEAMETTGAGDNPAFVRVLYALASKLTEGTSYVRGEPTTSTSRPSAGAAMYPNLPSESSRRAS